MDYTFRYRSKKVISTCSLWSSHAHGFKIRGRNSKHFQTSEGLYGLDQWATDSQVRKQVPGSNPRTLNEVIPPLV